VRINAPHSKNCPNYSRLDLEAGALAELPARENSVSILVFGSINMDLVVRTARIPTPGETLKGETFFTAPGGKGANQAVACARLGASTRMIGRVGNDVFATSLLESLQNNNVDTSGVVLDADHPSGIASIFVDETGQNSIVIVPGANGSVGEDDIRLLKKSLNGVRVLLLQLEIPIHSVMAAARAAREQGTIVILDPAPAQTLPSDLYPVVDILTPNESEATALVGFPVRAWQDAQHAARALIDRGVQQVIVKMGHRGAYWTDGENDQVVPAFPVQTVDSVGAGDAFNGGLAVALDEGQPIADALHWASACGALSTTKQGAQPSMPHRGELMSLLT
jgi:ribokinase